jgi:tetratricopeptide (TPR) repeat protein
MSCLIVMRFLRDRLVAWHRQQPMLIFMVGYTVMGLCLLAQPMVEGEAHESHPTTTEAAVSQTPSAGLSHSPPGEGSVGNHSAVWETDGVDDPWRLTPEQAKARLQTLMALPREPHPSNDFAVHTSVLCFCLDKGPATVRELRRLAGDWYDRGLRALQAHDEATAVTAFTQALQRSPRDARTYFNRGLAYARLENYQSAMADLAQVINLAPQLMEAYNLHRLVIVLTGNTSQANQEGQRAPHLHTPAR